MYVAICYIHYIGVLMSTETIYIKPLRIIYFAQRTKLVWKLRSNRVVVMALV